MTIEGTTRKYTWEDVQCLLLKDMGLDPKDRQHHELFYSGSFRPPEHVKDVCIEITKYEQDYRARLDEHMRDKL